MLAGFPVLSPVGGSDRFICVWTDWLCGVWLAFLPWRRESRRGFFFFTTTVVPTTWILQPCKVRTLNVTTRCSGPRFCFLPASVVPSPLPRLASHKVLTRLNGLENLKKCGYAALSPTRKVYFFRRNSPSSPLISFRVSLDGLRLSQRDGACFLVSAFGAPPLWKTV